MVAGSLAHSVGWSSTSGFTVILCQRNAITGAIEHHEEAGDIGVRLCCRVSLSTVRTSLSLVSIGITRKSSPDEINTIGYGCVLYSMSVFCVCAFCSFLFCSFLPFFVCFVCVLCVFCLAPVHAGRHYYSVFLGVGDILPLYI